MKTQASAIPRLRNSSFVITSSVSQLLYSCVRAKTLPEKLQSAIISFTLFKAGMCSPLPSNLTWVNVKVERRIEGAASPQTNVVAASEGDVGENWKLEANRKPVGLNRNWVRVLDQSPSVVGKLCWSSSSTKAL